MLPMHYVTFQKSCIMIWVTSQKRCFPGLYVASKGPCLLSPAKGPGWNGRPREVPQFTKSPGVWELKDKHLQGVEGCGDHPSEAEGSATHWRSLGMLEMR